MKGTILSISLPHMFSTKFFKKVLHVMERISLGYFKMKDVMHESHVWFIRTLLSHHFEYSLSFQISSCVWYGHDVDVENKVSRSFRLIYSFYLLKLFYIRAGRKFIQPCLSILRTFEFSSLKIRSVRMSYLIN